MLGCSPFLNFLSCTILDRGPALLAYRCSTGRAHSQPHPHSLTVTYTLQFCSVKASQRPLRHSWLQVSGAFWVGNDAPLANTLLGWKVQRSTQVPRLCSPCTEQPAGSHSFTCQVGWDVRGPVTLQKSLQSGEKSCNLRVNEAGWPRWRSIGRNCGCMCLTCSSPSCRQPLKHRVTPGIRFGTCWL